MADTFIKKHLQSKENSGYELHGLRQIVDNYDVFIIDLWGVVHNGVKVFDPIFRTFERLKELGKTIYLITNNPRTREENMVFLEKMGITRNLYSELLTAGEKTLELFKMHLILPDLPRPIKTFALDDTKLCTWHEQAGLTLVDDINEADLLLAIHIEDNLVDGELYRPLLEKAMEKKLTFVCSNPDRYVTRYDKRFIRVGVLAEMYQKMGGSAILIGKPHAIMFEDVMNDHKDHLDRILLVGDSLVTDISAACEMGVDSLLVTYGYHREELHTAKETISHKELFDLHNVHPTFVCEQLFW